MNSVVLFFTTVISSGAVAAVISFSFTESKERWLLRRAKIEETYINAAAWIRDAKSVFMLNISVCDGSISYNDMLDLQIEKADDAKIRGDQKLRMQMNIHMYEQDLMPFLNELEKELSELNKITSAIRSCYKETGQASEFTEIMRRQLMKFGSAGERLQAAIVERGAIVGAEKGQAVQTYQRVRVKVGEMIVSIRHFLPTHPRDEV